MKYIIMKNERYNFITFYYLKISRVVKKRIYFNLNKDYDYLLSSFVYFSSFIIINNVIIFFYIFILYLY